MQEAGKNVVLVDVDAVNLEWGMGVIRNTCAQCGVGKSKTQDKVEQFLGDRAPSTYGALAPCDKVIEAVFVTMALKKIFARLGEVFKPGCVLSSNTDVLNMRISCQLSVRSRCMPLPTLDRTSTCQSSSAS